MAKISSFQSNFAGGIVDPLFQGRVDNDRYFTSLDECTNWIPTIQGALTRRGGTRRVTASPNAKRIAPYNYSATNVAIIEFSTTGFRVLEKDGTELYNSGVLTIDTLPSPVDVEAVDWVQIGNSFVWVDGKRPPQLIQQRRGGWHHEAFMTRGPYGPNVLNDPLAAINVATDANDGYRLSVEQQQFGNFVRVDTYSTLTPTQQAMFADLRAIDSTTDFVVFSYNIPDSIINRDLAGQVGDVVGIYDIKPDTAALSDDHGFQDIIWVGVLFPGVAHRSVVLGTYNPLTNMPLAGFYTITGGPITDFKIRHAIFRLQNQFNTTFDTVQYLSSDIGAEVLDVQSGDLFNITFKQQRNQSYVNALRLLRGDSTTDALVDLRLNFRVLGNYPTTAGFYQNRLAWAGAENAPTQVDMSQVNSYGRFTPRVVQTFSTELNIITRSPTPISAISEQVNSEVYNRITVVHGTDRGLFVGTEGGEWLVHGGNDPLTYDNISIEQKTKFGCAKIQPINVQGYTIFVDATRKALRAFSPAGQGGRFNAIDINQYAHDILSEGGGVKRMAYQKLPQAIMWCVLEDGTLAGVNISESVDGLTFGWHRHELAGLGATKVRDIITLPNSDTGEVDVFLLVDRYDSATPAEDDDPLETTIERLTDAFEGKGPKLEDHYFLDGGYIQTPEKRGVSAVNVGGYQFDIGFNIRLSNADAANFASGDTVGLEILKGHNKGKRIALEIRSKVVRSNYTLFTFLYGVDETGVGGDFASSTLGITGVDVAGTVRLTHSVNYITVPDTWKGKTVRAVVDGRELDSPIAVAEHTHFRTSVKTQRVYFNDGGVNRGVPAFEVAQVGFGYTSRAKTLQFYIKDSQEGYVLGELIDIHNVKLLVSDTRALRVSGLPTEEDAIGDTFSEWTNREGQDDPYAAIELFNGIVSEITTAAHTYDARVTVESFGANPATILSILPSMYRSDSNPNEGGEDN